MVGKTPIYRLSHSKAPKTQQTCHYRHGRKTSRLFLCDTGVDFISRNNFANVGFFAKVFVSVQLIIPWFVQVAIKTAVCFKLSDDFSFLLLTSLPSKSHLVFYVKSLIKTYSNCQ